MNNFIDNVLVNLYIKEREMLLNWEALNARLRNLSWTKYRLLWYMSSPLEVCSSR